MEAVYFTINTTGPRHDRDQMDEYSGILYDHDSGRAIDTFHYHIVADMHLINGSPIEAYRAAELLQAWMSKDCFYFTVNADKAKHFIRSSFFYQYLNPFIHERSGRQNKIVDFMMLLRSAFHIGESPVELPVSPIGEIRYEISLLKEMNFPGKTNEEAMAGMVSSILAKGGRPFSWLKTQDEKKKLLSGQQPIVHLGLIDKEIDVQPRILIPFAASDNNRNRFYVYEPSQSIKTPEQAMAAHIDYLARGERSVTNDMKGKGVFYIDANKSDLLMALKDTPTRYRLDFLTFDLPRRGSQTLSRLTNIFSKMSEIEEACRHRGGESMYQMPFTRNDTSKWEVARIKLIKGDISGAREVLTASINSKIEQKRFDRFIMDNNIKENNVETIDNESNSPAF